MITICAVGGYNEVGKNMTAVKVDDEVVILDMGLQLEKYIAYTEDEEEDIKNITAPQLTKVGAIPDMAKIEDWRKRVKAIITTHAHLDHIGAIPFLAKKFKANIYCTPFTKAVLKIILKDEKIHLRNKIVSVNANSGFAVSKNISVEFINMTHSTPQTVMIALHTKYGTIIYANDFKFDNFPTLGKKPNYKRLKEIGEKGVKCLILDSIYSKNSTKTPSESVAREMLKEVLSLDLQGKTVFITTFASHLARLKSIIEFSKRLNRKILFLGRSLAKYVQAGEEVGIINFSKDVEIVKYGAKIRKRLRKIKNPADYVFVCTGHQAEPKSVLSKLVNNVFQFEFKPGDYLIFSSGVIPVPINIANREALEKILKEKGVRIFKDIHVSGHAAKEDQRDLIQMTKPAHIIPAHGDFSMASALAELAIEEGYKLGDGIHIMKDGQRIIIK